jgi:hypothetical protein
MMALGMVLYVACFSYMWPHHSGSLFLIITVVIPLVPVFYFVIGFIIGLLSRMVRAV